MTAITPTLFGSSLPQLVQLAITGLPTVGAVRTNLSDDPRFIANGDGWAGAGAPGVGGVLTASGTPYTEYNPAPASSPVSVSFDATAGSVADLVIGFQLRPTTAAGAFSGLPVATKSVTVPRGTTARLSTSGYLHADSGGVRFQLTGVTGFGNGAKIDRLLWELAPSPSSYFDGDTEDTTAESFDWTGSPNASNSTATSIVDATNVNVWAEPPNSPRRIVRGGYDLDPASDALVLVDSLPELGRPIIYVVEWTAGAERSQLSSQPITVPDPGRHVISDPFTGQAVLVDVLADPDERDNELRGVVLYPSGSRVGVQLDDGREADAGTLRVYADAAASAELVELLSSGSPLVSRHPNDGCDIAPVEILSVAGASRARRSRAGDRIHTLPFRTVAQPDPRQPVQTETLGELAAYYEPTGTLSDLAADYPTLLVLALAEWS